MSVEEQIKEYMSGWMIGVLGTHDDGGDPFQPPVDDHERGYNAGRAAYLAAEQAERARLERCPTCEGKRTVLDALGNVAGKCPDCHGTGKRREP